MEDFDVMKDEILVLYGYRDNVLNERYKWRTYDKREECARIVARTGKVQAEYAPNWFPAVCCTVKVSKVWLLLIEEKLDPLLASSATPGIWLPNFDVSPLEVVDTLPMYVPFTDEEMLTACREILRSASKE